MKKIYQSPCAHAYTITGRKAFVQTSMTVGGTVNKSSDIGFVKEQNSQNGNTNAWDDEW
ncbi:MAG: hypothetical protein IJS63_02815 [Bacteroidaceae bacterium]|nr:hypothetical protein [Bacteroidaceae bacterium]